MPARHGRSLIRRSGLDARYGEEICAGINLKGSQSATAEEIRDFGKGQIAHD